MIAFRDTPVERHSVSGVGEVLVKREDLAAPPPMPPLAKLRGVARLLERIVERDGLERGVGVLDTRVSKSGLGVAVLCRDLGLPCRYYFPETRSDREAGLPEWRLEARRHGAELIPLAAGRFGVVKSAFVRREGRTALPVGFPLYETVVATAEVAEATPELRDARTLVVACGTGTILAGLVVGLGRLRARDLATPVVIVGVTASMDPKRVARTAGYHFARARAERLVKAEHLEAVAYNVRLHREGSDYYEEVAGEVSWPTHGHYEGKALRWLRNNADALPRPILFWNVGS